MNLKLQRILTVFLFLFSGLVAVLLCSRQLPTVSSDGLYSLSFYRDIFERGISVKGWAPTPAPYFFPDLAVTWAFFGMTPDSGFGFALYMVFMAAVLVFCVLRIERLTRIGEGSFALAFSALLLFFAATAVSGPADSVAWFLFFPTFHGGAAFLSLVLLWLVAKDVSAQPRWAEGPLFVLTYLGFLSDFLVAAQFLAPAMLALWTIRGYIGRPAYSRLLKVFGAGVLAASVTYVVFVKSGLFPIGSGKPHVFLGGYIGSVATFLRDVPMYLTKFWPYSSFVVLWSLVALWSVNSGRSSQIYTEVSARRRFVLIYALLATWMSVAAAVMNGGYSDMSIARRFIPTFVFPFFFVSVLSIPTPSARVSKVLAGFSLVLAILVQIPWAQKFEMSQLRMPYPDDVRCIDEAAQARGLKWGMGDYWTGKYVSELSRNGIWVNQVSADIHPYWWIANPNWYADTAERKIDYRFVILNQLNEGRAQERGGPPSEIKTCGQLRVAFYDKSLPRP